MYFLIFVLTLLPMKDNIHSLSALLLLLAKGFSLKSLGKIGPTSFAYYSYFLSFRERMPKSNIIFKKL